MYLLADDDAEGLPGASRWHLMLQTHQRCLHDALTQSLTPYLTQSHTSSHTLSFDMETPQGHLIQS
eukprot:5144491-Pyramimonas_sp.AAC.1